MPCAGNPVLKPVYRIINNLDSHISFDKNWFFQIGDHFFLNLHSVCAVCVCVRGGGVGSAIEYIIHFL
jgi:hypothetical protein